MILYDFILQSFLYKEIANDVFYESVYAIPVQLPPTKDIFRRIFYSPTHPLVLKATPIG